MGDRGVSLPMRGAWIEITRGHILLAIGMVAPHAGSVDWNLVQTKTAPPGRSPCGECGLKYAEDVKRPSQGMYRDGRWCIFGVIPYLTAIGGRYAVQYSKKRDD